MFIQVPGAFNRPVFINVNHIVRFFQATSDRNHSTIITTDQTQQTYAITIADLERQIKEAS